MYSALYFSVLNLLGIFEMSVPFRVSPRLGDSFNSARHHERGKAQWRKSCF